MRIHVSFMHDVEQNEGPRILRVEWFVGKPEVSPRGNPMFPPVVLRHAGEGRCPADLGQERVEFVRWFLAENIRVNGQAADVRKSEQQACAALENKLQPSRRQRIQQDKCVDRLFQQHGIATTKFLSFARLPFSRKAFV